MRRGGFRKKGRGRGTSLSSVHTHRIAPRPDVSLGLSRVSGAPGLPSPGDGDARSRSLTCLRPPSPPQPSAQPRGSPLPRLPRPRSLQPPANRWAVSEVVLTPCARVVQSEPTCRGSPACVRRAPARATAQFARGSRPKCAPRFSGVQSVPRAAFRRMRAGRMRACRKATPPRVLARISMDPLRLLPQIAAGPGGSEGLTHLGLLAWRPAREIPPLQAPLPFSVPVPGRACPPFSRSVPGARLREGIIPEEGDPSRPTTEFPVLPDSRASSLKPPLPGDGSSSLPSFRHRSASAGCFLAPGVFPVLVALFQDREGSLCCSGVGLAGGAVQPLRVPSAQPRGQSQHWAPAALSHSRARWPVRSYSKYVSSARSLRLSAEEAEVHVVVSGAWEKRFSTFWNSR